MQSFINMLIKWLMIVHMLNVCLWLACRMDADQSARNLAQKVFGVQDPDYYEFEGILLHYN